jgi:heterodisulfide reductase subunit C
MSEKPLLLDSDRRFRNIVIESVGKEVFNCYQCSKCSAGCPVAFAMDLLPHQVIRSVLFGKKEKVLSSSTIWICASCETCTTRCPNEIDIAQVMDVLRQLQYESGCLTPQPKIPILHSTFLNSIKKTGRVHELSMIRNFSIKSGDLKEKLKKGTWKNDMKLAVKMFLRGKLKLFPHVSKGVKDVRTLFNQAQEHKKT